LLQSANRSLVVDRVAPRRDVGVLAQLVGRKQFRLQAAVVNGDGPNRATNSDGREMVFGRLTVFPVEGLGVAGKYMGHGDAHAWGGDVRWIGQGAIVEAEFIGRRGLFAPGTTVDSRGGYVLASYKIQPWLQPLLKWEELHDDRTNGTGTTNSRAQWTTVGLNLVTRAERVRFQLNAIFKSEQPVVSGDELVAQLIAIF
jgi:hypothetical protein